MKTNVSAALGTWVCWKLLPYKARIFCLVPLQCSSSVWVVKKEKTKINEIIHTTCQKILEVIETFIVSVQDS